MPSTSEIDNLKKELAAVLDANEYLKKKLSAILDANGYLKNLLDACTKSNDNLKNELASSRTVNENMKLDLDASRSENEALIQKTLNITLQKRFAENNQKLREFIYKQIASVSEVKSNVRTQEKLFTIITELLRHGEVKFDDIENRFWKSKQNRARCLRHLFKLGYVRRIKRGKKTSLVLSPSGKELEKKFGEIMGD